MMGIKKNRVLKALKHICLSSSIVFGLLFVGGTVRGSDSTEHAAASDTGTVIGDDFIGSLPSWWHLLDVLPLEAGSPITVSNSSFEVTLSSDIYVILDDFTTSSVWAHVRDLGGSDNEFTFSLISAVPAGWQAPGASSAQPLPGNEGDIRFILPRSLSSDKIEGTFTYQVSSDQYVETLNFTFTLNAFPQISSTGYPDGNATVEGTITDAVTGNPISGAEVTLWLGFTTRILPYDMIYVADSVGFYRMQCWDIDALNTYYAPYLTVPGYMLMVQKKGYETYVHNAFVYPQYGSPITFNASLTPLDNPVDYELMWETPLSSPGVWGIAVNDAWDRFAVAMGKHPDPDDPATLPTSIPFLDSEGTILWSKPLDDQSWAVDIASDGSYIACTTHASGNNYCYLWEADGDEAWKKNMTTQSTTVTFSPDNQYIATGPAEGGDGFVLYNTLTGVEEWSYDTGRQRVRQTAFNADGQHVILGPPLHRFTLGGQLVWWRNEDTGLPYIICPTTDESRLLVPDKGGCLSMFDGDGSLMWRKEHRVQTYGGMSADGSVVVALSHNGNLYCYNKEGELQWYRFVPGSGNGGGAGHDGVDITPDGNYIVIGGGNYNTVLYDSDGNVLWRHTGTATIDPSEHPYKHAVMNVRISEDGEKIVSGYGMSDPRLCYFEKSTYTPPDAIIHLSRTSITYGAIGGGDNPSDQDFSISNDGVDPFDWTITDNASWLSCSPLSGTSVGLITASVNISGLQVGTYSGRITVSSAEATNSPQYVSVALNVYDIGIESAPFGYFDTPIHNSTVSGSIPVTGWALDDVEVTKVEIKRDYHPDDPIAAIGGDGLVYIGDALFVKGARPDVEAAFPDYPRNDIAGWGYMMLTFGLPLRGNDTFVIYAVAYDGSGHRKVLGDKTIIADNNNRIKPFGAIDTPAPGGIASGSVYTNFGWALTPAPKWIPYDGSTIWVYVDGVALGQPVYGEPRQIIADMFPECLNKDGPVGYYYLDTTQYENGVHTIAWSATDNEGAVDGIGSRYFSIQNVGGSIASVGMLAPMQHEIDSSGRLWIGVEGVGRGFTRPGLRIKQKNGLRGTDYGVRNLSSERIIKKMNNPFRFQDNPSILDPDFSSQFIVRGKDSGLRIKDYAEDQTDGQDVFELEIEELERVVVKFKGRGGNRFIGWGRDETKRLPIGSTLDAENGIFYWMPGPGFLGKHVLNFAVTDGTSRSRPLTVIINIKPKSYMKK